MEQDPSVIVDDIADDFPSLDDVVIPQHPCPPARCTLEEWEAEAAQLEHLKGGWIALAVEAADARCRFNLEHGNGRYGGAQAVHDLARKGARFDEIARLVGTTIPTVARMFAQADRDVSKFLAAEELVRTQPVESYEALAQAAGLTVDQAMHFCEALGVQSEVVKRVKAGGGLKVTAEQIAKIKELREAGRSYSQIGRVVGLKDNTVTRICLRKGFTKGGEA